MRYSILICISIFIVCCQTKKPKFTTGLEGEPMPAIDILLPDSITHLTINNVKTTKPVILFSFEPWCPYCKAQTKSIISNIESLKEIDFYFITNSTMPGLKEFYSRFELQKYPNIKAGIDYNYSFTRYFKTRKIPVMAIYDTEKNLKQFLIGKNYISTIKEIALN